jgi:hypothetical protein
MKIKDFTSITLLIGMFQLLIKNYFNDIIQI